MVRRKEWRTYLDGLDAFIDWEVHREDADVVFFKINFCAVVGGDIVQVCRYDTCHGFLHVHRYWMPLADQTVDLEDPAKPFPSYREAFRRASQDLQENWDDYRKQMAPARRGVPAP